MSRTIAVEKTSLVAQLGEESVYNAGESCLILGQEDRLEKG